MRDTIRKVEYFKLMVVDKPGASAKIFTVLAEAGVNLLAFSGFPRGGRAQLDFVPEDASAFRMTLRKAGVPAGKGKTAFLIQGADRPGAGWKTGEKLGKAGINITAMNAVVAGGGRFGAILWVKSRDVSRAAKALGAD